MEKRLLLFAVLLSIASGCSDEVQSIPASPVERNSPEGQFEWFIQRLERAVLDFSSSQTSGLSISNRTLDSELIPPSQEVDYYRAKVTISYEAAYVPESIPTIVDKDKEEEKRREKMRRMESYSGLEDDPDQPMDPLADKFRTEMEDLAASSRLPARSPDILETPNLKDTKVYELAYHNDQWEVVTELESESEKLWFDYALGKDLTR